MPTFPVRQLNEKQQNEVLELMLASQRFQRSRLDGLAIDEYFDSDRRMHFKEALERPAFEFLVDVHNDQPIGFVKLHVDDAKPNKRCWVEDLYVHPHHRRRGIARGLMAEAIKWAEQAGAPKLELTVARNNPAARTLYQALGFKEVPSTYSDMERTLT